MRIIDEPLFKIERYDEGLALERVLKMDSKVTLPLIKKNSSSGIFNSSQRQETHNNSVTNDNGGN